MFHIKKSSNSTIHVHDVFMHIPDFFARTWQWEHPVTRPCCNKKTTEAQLHWDGTQPFTQVVDKLTTAHLEDEMHRRFLLHLVRISGKCTNGKSQTKTYNGQDPRSKVGLWKTNLFFLPAIFSEAVLNLRKQIQFGPPVSFSYTQMKGKAEHPGQCPWT